MEDTQIKNLINEINNVMNKLKKEEDFLLKKISYYDIIKSEYEHLFENSKFPAHIRAHLDKNFDSVLKERREYKIKYDKVIQIKNMLKQKGINFDASRIKEESSYGVRFLKDEFEMYKDYIKFPWKNK